MFRKPAAALAALLPLLTALTPTHDLRSTISDPPALVASVAPRFQGYYYLHQGLRVLGNPVTDSLYAYSYPAQYFEKGRIEDHRGESANPDWAFSYGLLTSELMEAGTGLSVSSTDLTYGDLSAAHDPALRQAPPTDFVQGTAGANGGTFIPYDPGLASAPGYIVPAVFWDYVNRTDLFPGGWLHDVGLPLTGVLNASVVKDGNARDITIQAFERAVLSYDPQNPADFQVERGNIGSDAATTLADNSQVEADAAIQIPAANAVVTLPLHIIARFRPTADTETEITAELRWDDGTVFTNTLPLLRDDGDAIVVDSINWLIESEPPRPATPQATLTLAHMAGDVIARQDVTVLHFDSPDTQQVQLYFLDDQGELHATTRSIPRTQAVGSAALQELIWGIDPISLAGFTTAIPTPEEVLSRRADNPTWGPRVTLRSLVINNGVATADFSEEINAYGGGSARVDGIFRQVTSTLQQFPAVKEVRITVEGQSAAVLQP
jgi:hypothetical protein